MSHTSDIEGAESQLPDLGPGTRARLLGWSAAALAVVLAFAHWYSFHPLVSDLWSSDAYEYAVIARHIAEGEGFTTSYILPAEITQGDPADHPSLLRAPLWPLLLGGAFALGGSDTTLIHGATLVFYLATVGATVLLGSALAGPAAGIVAGLAAAGSTNLVLYTADGVSEELFGFLLVLAFLLYVRGAHAAWIGLVCALAYLTRYNGGLLLPALMALLAWRTRSWKAPLWCAVGFAAAASPWWIRNLLVTGNPFFNLYDLSLYFHPLVTARNATLWYHLEPDTSARLTMHPLDKIPILLPYLVSHFPLANANMPALLGLLLACVRRHPLALASAGLIVATTLVVAVALPNGRYLIPLLPITLALGAAGWSRYAGILRWPGLALVAAAPLLPSLVPDTKDLHLHRMTVAAAHLADEHEEARAAERASWERLAACLEGRPLVLSRTAPRLAWETDAVAIALPASDEDFWKIVERYPVGFAQIRNPTHLFGAEFARRFSPRKECAPDLYQLGPVGRGSEEPERGG